MFASMAEKRRLEVIYAECDLAHLLSRLAYLQDKKPNQTAEIALIQGIIDARCTTN